MSLFTEVLNVSLSVIKASLEMEKAIPVLKVSPLTEVLNFILSFHSEQFVLKVSCLTEVLNKRSRVSVVRDVLEVSH